MPVPKVPINGSMLGRTAATERSAQQQLLISSHPTLLETRPTAERAHAPHYLHPLYKQLNRRSRKAPLCWVLHACLYIALVYSFITKQMRLLSELKNWKVGDSDHTKYLITVASLQKQKWMVWSPETGSSGGVLMVTKLHYKHIKWPAAQRLMELHGWVKNSHCVCILNETRIQATTLFFFFYINTGFPRLIKEVCARTVHCFSSS